MTAVIKRVCNLCEAMCGLTIQKEGERILSIRGNQDDVFSAGAFCPKSQGLLDIYQDSERIRQPLKKTAKGFQEISWKQAFDEIAAKVNSLQKQYGRSAIATYAGNPNVHNYSSLLMLGFFLKALGTPNKFSATSVDQLPHQLLAYLMFGHQLLIPIPDVDRTDFMLIFGANPVVSNGSLMSAAGLSSRLKAIQKRGGNVIVFDPRYTETASLASQHHFIRPGTDAFFLAGLVKILLEEKDLPLGRLSDMIEGLDELKKLFADFDLQVIPKITGVSLEVLHDTASQFRQAKSAVCYGRMGVSTQAFGTICHWLINVLNIITGNFDRPGGALFTKPAFDTVAFMAKFGSRGRFASKKSRVRSLPDFSGEFPVATLADEIITPGKGQIRGLFSIAGNPVLSVPNGTKLEKALAQLDLYVAIDFYRNETTRFADYILPPVSSLEHSHYDLIFNSFAIRNIARYSPAIFPKPKGAKDDGEILLELWSRIGGKISWLQKKQRALAKLLFKTGGFELALDLGLRFGPYRQQKLSLKSLKENPDGIDFGPLEPSLPERLYTKNKKIQVLPQEMRQAWRHFRVKEAELERLQQKREKDEFVMIGRRNLRSNNSWMHNCKSLLKQKNSCFVMINTDDAKQRDIGDGAMVQVSSKVGSIELTAKLTEHIMSGVVSIPHGWGHHRPGTGQSWAQQHAGVSLNDIMDDTAVDEFSGNAVLNGQSVRVQLASSGQGPV
ncbi:MAG: molybdopterin-dependent oxidoreductase [Oligoflexus sp.]